MYYFACAGPGEQTHTNKTGTHVAHSMGAGLALIRYPLQAIMAFLRGMLACPVGTAANETEAIRRFVGI